MTIQEFSSLKKKELNTTYSVDVDGVTKVVELTDSKREEKKVGSKNQKTLYLAKVDGVSYEDYFNITDLCKKIAGKNVAPRQISENAAAHLNLRTLSSFKENANFEFLKSEAARFEQYQDKIREYTKKYGFIENTCILANAAVGVKFYSEYQAKKRHAQKRWEQYQTARQARIDNFEKSYISAKDMLASYMGKHYSELTKHDIIQQVQKLSKQVEIAETAYNNEKNREFLTDKDICQKYGIEL